MSKSKKTTTTNIIEEPVEEVIETSIEEVAPIEENVEEVSEEITGEVVEEVVEPEVVEPEIPSIEIEPNEDGRYIVEMYGKQYEIEPSMFVDDKCRIEMFNTEYVVKKAV